MQMKGPLRVTLFFPKVSINESIMIIQNQVNQMDKKKLLGRTCSCISGVRITVGIKMQEKYISIRTWLRKKSLAIQGLRMSSALSENRTRPQRLFWQSFSWVKIEKHIYLYQHIVYKRRCERRKYFL